MKEKIKSYLSDIWKSKIKKITFLMFFLCPFVAYCVIEALNQRSASAFWTFLTGHTVTFVLNYLIVLFTVSIVLVLKRRIAPLLLICFVWIGFGVANFLLKSYRETPFSANDLRLASSVFSIASKYLDGPLGIFLVILIVLALLFVLVLWIKLPKYDQKINYPLNILLILMIGVVSVGSAKIGIAKGMLSTKYPNMSIAYRDYGFAYCFANSVINVGVKKPKEYSAETIQKIKSRLDKAEVRPVEEAETPNIIFLQLESFFDVEKVIPLELSQPATPYFNELKEKFPSGFLSVNNVGYGTANTEFEMMTGMNLEDFGPGEFPFKTVLQNNTCESVAYVLRDYGYSSHVIHDNNASFYSRNKVLRNLGMNSFTSVEFMNPTEYTPLGWVKDKILTDEILKVLDSTDEQDFIYTISVQGHGSYPTYQVLEEPEITVSGLDDDERLWQFEYYVNEIHEMDAFIKELTDTLQDYNEDVILVMYGDHLPSLELTEDELENHNLYQTEYVVWSNCGFELPDADLETYQIYPTILEKLGIEEGLINKFHRIYKNDSRYLESLKTLEYDMLYGDRYVYEGESPIVATDMQMGTYPIKIDQVERIEKPEIFAPYRLNTAGWPEQVTLNEAETETGEYVDPWEYYEIKGNYFSPFSCAYVNSEKCATQFVDENTLIVRAKGVNNLDAFSVKQLWKLKSVVAESEEFIYIGMEEEQTTEPLQE